MDKKGDSALVLFSGGQDSTTCLFWAKQQFGLVEAIGFDYGQRHRRELELAQEIAEEAHISYFVHSLDVLNAHSASALIDPNAILEEEAGAGSPPNSLVEGRNLLFLTYAAIYAKGKGIADLVIGAGQTDYSGYPDCRNDFIQSAQQTLSLALDYPLIIHAPLMWKDKRQTWQLAEELGILELIKVRTLTCYNGIPGEGCGNCPACRLRRKGYDEFIKSI